MTENGAFLSLLRSAVPPVAARQPAHDAWVRIVARVGAGPEWSWIDVGVAAAAGAGFMLRPDLMIWLAYHL